MRRPARTHLPAPSDGLADSMMARARGQVALTTRSLSLALGLLWLLDGVLQLQPYMFTQGFARQVIAPAAGGQPSLVSSLVRWNARLISEHPVPSNALFAAVQLALGVGFLVRRTATWAIVGSVVWASGIWLFGEGLGGVLGGHTSALAGAPGAALLYVILAVAAWPGSAHQPARPDRRPSPWVIRAWAALWLGFAGLGTLPANLAPSSTARHLRDAATSVPLWLGSIDRGTASAAHALGPFGIALLVTLEGAVGLLSLGHGRMQPVAAWTGIALAGVYWMVGQSFGLVFSGQATDPSTGPLVVLLGLAAVSATRLGDRCRTRAVEWSDPAGVSHSLAA
jgi:hypothetical protein